MNNPELVTAAVRELRTALGETQQGLANRLGIAISTMVRYESSRAPKGKALGMFWKLAAENNKAALADVFRDAMAGEMGQAVLQVAPELRKIIEQIQIGLIEISAHPELPASVKAKMAELATRATEAKRLASADVLSRHMEDEDLE